MNDDGEDDMKSMWCLHLLILLLLLFLLVWLFAPPPLSNDEFVHRSFICFWIYYSCLHICFTLKGPGWTWFSEAAAVELSPAISSLSSTAYSICSAFNIFCHSIIYLKTVNNNVRMENRQRHLHHFEQNVSSRVKDKKFNDFSNKDKDILEGDKLS